jgi:ribosome-associated protein
MEFLPNARRIGSALADFKVKNLKAFDVRALTVLTDCIMMCTVTSQPQLKAAYSGVRTAMTEIKVSPSHSEGAFDSNWLVLDYGVILVHIFREEAYEFYGLDSLWGDAPAVDLGIEP